MLSRRIVARRRVKELASRAQAIAICGILLVVIPFFFLVVPLGLSFEVVESIWAAMWVAGYLLVLAGVALLGGLASPVPRPFMTLAGSRLAVVSGFFLLAGFLILVAVIASISACESTCPNSGATSPGDAAASSGCGNDCATTDGAAVSIGPAQLLIGSFICDGIGVLLLTAACRSAGLSASKRTGIEGATLTS